MSKLAMEVFISSAMIELEHDREIAHDAIEEMALTSTMFELFPAMAESPSEVYLEKVRTCDIFVLLLWKSLTPAVRLEYEEALYRNKPILIFLKQLKNKETRTSDLSVFVADLQKGKKKATIYKEYRELKGLKEQLKKAVGLQVSAYYEFPKITQTKRELYEMGESILKNAYNRLYIYEKTPSIFLGCRGYTDDIESKLLYERKYFEALKQWIEDNKNNENAILLYVYSNDRTKAEIAPMNNNTKYIRSIIDNIKYYKECEKRTGGRFKFVPVTSYISGPMIVGDISYAMWFLGDAVSISQRNEKLSDEIVKLLNRYHDTVYSVQEMLEQLGLQHIV